jgi:diguanylate cyclase (GGDEF)-like protein/PAS domain S-box-containing protein
MMMFRKIDHFSDLHRMGAAVFSAILLVVFFVLTQPINQQRHNTLMSYFSQLQSDQANLVETVLELNFSLSNNYDKVNAIFEHMREAARLLRETYTSGYLNKDVRFKEKLELFEKRLVIQSEALEQFKSSNAVLKNSLIYLPNARDEVELAFPPGSVFHEQLDDLVEKVIMIRIKGGLSDQGEFNTAFERVQKDSLRLPATHREKVKELLNHIRNINRVSMEMPGLISLLSNNIESTDLEDAYRIYYDSQQQRASTYRVFLLLATLILLTYVFQVLIRQRHQSNQLKLAANVFDSSSDGITITDIQGRILQVNPAFVEVTGYTREEILGKNPRILRSGRQTRSFYEKMWRSINDTGQWQGEIWNRRKNGIEYPEWLTITAVKDDEGMVTNYVGTFRDITLSKAAEDEIKHLAFYDTLSGLPNRRLLLDRLHHALASSARSGREGALLFIDLDNFKTINDTLGHYIGDLLLQQVSHRIESCVREGDTVARLGGDEFVVMLEDLSEHSLDAAAQTKLVAEKILVSLNLPYKLAEHDCRNTPSIGATLFSSHQQSVDILMKQADIAMYQAKKAGRNTLRFFDQQMQASINERADLEKELNLAVENKQFLLYFQIQVDSDGKPLGAEVLIRWIHPERGMVSPAAFIPLAEESGLILPIGQFVLDTACAQLKAWQGNEFTEKLTLSVNVSAKQFQEASFVDKVRAAVEFNRINPMLLKIEPTESVLLENIEDTIVTMNNLKAIGVRFALDDFGTGFSSLQYLKRLPLDQLKIDQSFVRDISTDNSDKAIVSTIIGMAQRLGLDVIAEGVETEEQRQFLHDSGCHKYQGYLFGKPMPIEQFETQLRS